MSPPGTCTYLESAAGEVASVALTIPARKINKPEAAIKRTIRKDSDMAPFLLSSRLSVVEANLVAYYPGGLESQQQSDTNLDFDVRALLLFDDRVRGADER